MADYTDINAYIDETIDSIRKVKRIAETAYGDGKYLPEADPKFSGISVRYRYASMMRLFDSAIGSLLTARDNNDEIADAYEATFKGGK